ncbi:MAG: hypothetical protein J1E39_05795 [Eubacterium sp.]|nr:hypothetical protein [Eubacterium sp.]
MEILNFGGFDYYVVYRIYVTEPCLLRPDAEIVPGCTRYRSTCAEPIDDCETYNTLEEGLTALGRHKSTVQRNVRRSLGCCHSIVKEYYLQYLIVDDKGKLVHVETDKRIYAEIEEK